MKKIIILALIISIALSVNAQIYSGAYLNNNYINTQMVKSGYGLGYKFMLGYKVNKKIKADINIASDLYTIEYISGDYYKMNSFYANFTYNITSKRRVKPYIGLGTGLFQKKTNLPYFDFSKPMSVNYANLNENEKSFGFLSTIGFELKHPDIKNLNWDIGISYYSIFTEYYTGNTQLKIGLLYYFNKSSS